MLCSSVPCSLPLSKPCSGVWWFAVLFPMSFGPMSSFPAVQLQRRCCGIRQATQKEEGRVRLQREASGRLGMGGALVCAGASCCLLAFLLLRTGWRGKEGGKFGQWSSATSK